MLTYLAIADRYRPERLVWENVPGVLSSNRGRDFGTFLGALVQLGYGFAYRVLDAQYFGVPQRRRRVFVVGSLRGWQDSAAILFERNSMCGNPPPSRKAGKEITANITNSPSHWEGGPHPTLSQSLKSSGGIGMSNQELFSQKGSGLVLDGVSTARMVAFGEYLMDGKASTVKRRDYKDATDLVIVHGTQDPCVSDNAFALGRNNGGENVVCFAQNTRDELREMKVAGALAANPGMKQQSYLREGLQVRRLTPIECERLQGFPDNYTRIPWKKKTADNCPDGPRYKALGNSMAVPVMRWIGERIELVENITKKEIAV
jgi:DNA (cytosine-5)-methyltransferase 1